MKSISLAGALALATAATLAVHTQTAHASVVTGKITFVGTVTELANPEGGFSARMRVRVNGTCDGDNVAKDRWVVLRSGRVDGTFGHNSLNMRNAFNTLSAAFLSGKSVQIDYSAVNCSTAAAISLDLWTTQVGMF